MHSHFYPKQTGFSLFNVLLWLILGGTIALFGTKVAPIYLENATILSVLKEMKTAGELNGSASNIRYYLNKRLQVNNINRFSQNDTESVKKQGRNLQVKYEVRQHLMSNMDIVIIFDNTVELASP
ncbi:hypothetical protein TI04_04910 [Achromatium sp. WMS2]|nr:hypothetical protein TI04_04910 [Achromatium sp. WMS2]